MSAEPPIYLDYAATSAVRPDAVIDAVTDYLRGIGATPGRAGHRRAVEAGRMVFRCRRALAELFNLPGDPGRLTFQLNATHALNLALFGVLRPGDRVVRTAYDHNAVRRPVNALEARGVRQTVLSGAPDGSVDLDEAARALAGNRNPARLLVLPHASNVLGTALPVAELASLAHDVGALVLVDAAQSAGHLPVDVQAMGIDLLAFTGHKGLLGPQGTGGLWARERVELPPAFFGGTGGDSDSPDMPGLLPDRLEAGSQNGPGIAGLLAGVQWVMERGVLAIHARQAALKLRLWYALDMIAGVDVLSPGDPDGVGIVTIAAAGMDAAELATRLDREAGVLVRAGLHCAPEQHEILGTGRTGAVRFSVGWATTEEEVDRAAAAVARIAGAAEPAVRAAGS
ncbi:MAG TPA: aminotransferase class V-fold PLP-dependent enzyme [Longimicrobium sp.]|jgi:cysteine desulfurase family protein|uniref:aminotransferase class V-fold PLP-dependent enzyme n=1 Tax=Longimicrobium sp. TaxID=2029185 RepID=UPI002ED986B8